MGPTNIALVKLFKADRDLRDAQDRHDAAARNVRIQERRLADHVERQRLAHKALHEQQARAKSMELDIAARDAHIEKARTQQQNTTNNREYQAFLVEISTAKVDKTKIEDELLKLSQLVEDAQKASATLDAQVEAERAKLQTMRTQIGASLSQLTAEVESLRPARAAAAAAVPPRAREAFERLSEHHEGEALSALDKPDRRREEYLCTACNMELARDVYNKLHSRDEIVFCPSCRRILYIPQDLTPEQALGASKPTVRKTVTATKTGAAGARAARGKGKSTAASAGEAEANAAGAPVVIEQRAKGKLGQVLAKAQGETVRSANAAGETPIECEVLVNGELAGIYKGQTVEKLERAVKYFMGDAGLFGTVEVRAVREEPEPMPAAESASAAPAASPPAEGLAVAVETAPPPPAVGESSGPTDSEGMKIFTETPAPVPTTSGSPSEQPTAVEPEVGTPVAAGPQAAPSGEAEPGSSN